MPPDSDDQSIGYQGAKTGFENVYYGARYGMGQMMGDIGQLGSMVNPMSYQQQAPAQYQHHGMTMFEMNPMQAMGAAFNIPFRERTPIGVGEVEYRQMAAQQLGQTMGKAAAYGGYYGATGLATTAAFLAAPLGFYGKRGFRAGRMAVGALGYGKDAAYVGKWIYSGAKAGSFAAKAGAFTASMGLGTTAGITAATVGAGVTGAAMALALPVAGMMAVEHGVSAVAEAAQERGEIQDYIAASSFRYAPASSGAGTGIFGGGFSRRQAGSIAEGMQNYEAKQTFYEMGDLKSILQKGTQIGLFAGTKDAEDFQKKFKETAETLKNVTKILHTTLSEGLDTIKALRDIGVTDPKLQMAAVNRADIIGLASGKTAGEAFTIGLQGAQVFRGSGVSMAAGAQSNQMIYAALESAVRSGNITEEQIAHMGGREAAAQAMSTQTMKFAQSSIGRGMMMAVAPTGEFSADAFNTFISGKEDIYKTLNKAAVGMSNPLNYMKFQTNQEKIMGDIMNQGSGFGAMMMPTMGAFTRARENMKLYNMENTKENLETNMKFVMRQMGYSAEETELSLKSLQNPENLNKELLAGLYQNTAKNAQESVREQYGWGNRLQRAFKAAKHPLTGYGQVLGRSIDDVSTWFTQWHNETVLGLSPVADLTVAGATASEYSKIINQDGTFKTGIESTNTITTLRNRVANGEVGGVTRVRQKDTDVSLGKVGGKDVYAPAWLVKEETGFGRPDITTEDIIAKQGGEIAAQMAILNPKNVTDDPRALRNGWVKVTRKGSQLSDADIEKLKSGIDVKALSVGGLFTVSDAYLKAGVEVTSYINPKAIQDTLELADGIKIGVADLADPFSKTTKELVAKNPAIKRAIIENQAASLNINDITRRIVLADTTTAGSMLDAGKAIEYANLQRSVANKKPEEAAQILNDWLGKQAYSNLNIEGQRIGLLAAQTSGGSALKNVTNLATAADKTRQISTGTLGQLQKDQIALQLESDRALSDILSGYIGGEAETTSTVPTVRDLANKISTGDFTDIKAIGLELTTAILEKNKNADGAKLGNLAVTLNKDENLKRINNKLNQDKSRLGRGAMGIIDKTIKDTAMVASRGIVDPRLQAKFVNAYSSLTDTETFISRASTDEGFKGLKTDLKTAKEILETGPQELKDTVSPIMASTERGLNVLEIFKKDGAESAVKVLTDNKMLASYAELKGVTEKVAAVDFTNESTRVKAVSEAIEYEGRKAGTPTATAMAAGRTAGGEHLPEVAAALKTVNEQTRSIAQAFQVLNIYAAALKTYVPKQ